MKIIISFSNVPSDIPVKHNLCVIDIETDEVSYLYNGSIGFSGLTILNNQLFAIEQTLPIHHLQIYDLIKKTLISRHPLSDMVDVHSIVFLDNVLHMVSTGTDEVRSVSIFQDGDLKSAVTYSPIGNSKDTIHINAITQNKGQLYVSMFGPRSSERWSSATYGSVVNITTGQVLYEKIYHPHSLVFHADDWYVCESSMRRVLQNGMPIISFEEGYVRGLAVSDEYVFVGVSSGRKNSKSLGIVNNPADQGELIDICKIYVYQKGYYESPVKVFSFTGEFPEIYDIILYN